MDTDNSQETRDLKAAATDFLRKAAAGDVDDAYAQYVSPSFRHHNPWFASDAADLKAGMREAAQANPGTTLEVQRVLQDGDFVAVHSRVRHKPEDPAIAVVHLFRFRDGLVEELWDIGQLEPPDMPNKLGMF